MPRIACRISPVLRFIIVIAFAVTSLLVADRSVADSRSGAGSDENRWIPSLGITLGATIHDHDGTAGSDGFRNGQSLDDPPPPDPLTRSTLNRPDAAGSQTLKAINVGGVLEIETPSIPIPFLRPRIFFGGELEHVSSQERNLATEGNPEPTLTAPAGNLSFSAVELNGRGTRTTSDLDNMQLGAWIGVSIPVQLGDWKVSIKPSARYLNQKVNFTGIFSHGIRDNFVDSGNRRRDFPTNTFLVQIEDSLDVHAIGPGLEIEIEVGAIRSLSTSVFINGGAYRVLSDRDIQVNSTGLGSTNSASENFEFETQFTAEIDPWLYRGNVGMRFKWKGSPEGWLFGLGG